MQPVFGQGGVELVEDQPRLHAGPALLDVQFEDSVQVLGKVDDQGGADRLAAEAGTAPTGHDAYAVLDGGADRRLHVGAVSRQKDSHGLDLIVAGVGGVDAAHAAVEMDLALDTLW